MEPGEVSELVGYGPLDISSLRHLCSDADPFISAVITHGQRVVGVANFGRRPNALQATALAWLYPTCAALGCPRSAHLQTDHREDWAYTHVTRLEALDRLCHAHHQLKTISNWSLVEGVGKRAFVGPDDPRHPRFAKPKRASA